MNSFITMRSVKIFGFAGALVVSLFGLFSSLPELGLLENASTEFIPMAPITALFFIILVTPLLIGEEKMRGRFGIALYLCATVFISLFGIAKFMECCLFHVGESFELSIIKTVWRESDVPIGIVMSPVTGLCFLFSGIFTITYLIQRSKRFDARSYGNIAGISAMLVFVSGVIFTTSYMHGIPLFVEEGRFVPMALTTAIAFIFFGTGMIAANGKNYLPLGFFTGQSTQARLVRIMFPSTVAIAVGVHVIEHIRAHDVDSLTETLYILSFVIAAGILTIYTGGIFGKKLDKAENELRRTNQSLLDSEARFKNIFEHARDGIILVNAKDKRFHMVNHTICEMLGYTRDELQRLSVPDIHPKEDLPYVLEKFKLQASEEITMAKGVPVKRKDGTIFYADISSSPHISGDERYLVGIFHDITEHKVTEELLKADKKLLDTIIQEGAAELLEAQKKLERATRLSDIGQLASTVAHELRNPLGVIKVAAHNIGRKSSDPDLKKHLNSIDKKIAESDQIIRNLLSYARITPPNYEHTDICALMDECIQNMRDKHSSHNVTVENGLTKMDKLFLEVDHVQMLEVVNNIIDNAYNAFPLKTGRIDITAIITEKGKTLKLNFKDNGEGIDPADIEKVYEPFFTKRARGIGLGLTVCRQITELHGGLLSISSEKGNGTVVTVSLPLSPPLT